MEARKTILCIEYDVKVLHNLVNILTGAGYIVLTAKNLNEAWEHMITCAPDCIILDITLPDGNCLKFLKELRAQSNYIPVLMLIERKRKADIAQGLDAGADDCMEKPFTRDVLLSRLKKIMFHAGRVPERITYGTLSLDIMAATAYMNGEDMLLTQKEFLLLLFFVQNEDRIISTKDLFETVWGTPAGFDKRALKKHVSNLRNRLEGEETGYTIRAAYNEGYSFEKV